MSDEFWYQFQNKNFEKALMLFQESTAEEKQIIFEALYQQSANNNKPFMISILRRVLHEDSTFNDFYQAWFPSEEMCNKTQVGGQAYQQHFPMPVRVFNATNLADPKEVMSIGITWASNKDEEAMLLSYIENAKQGNDANNEVRHEKINQEAEGELLGLFQVQTDDNLGKPF